ncbi:MAG: hypothetical protein KKC99_05005 [Proteobacteria bacterium]|nr:hypothetical protein [Pseudomonadota bacterium]
MKDEGLKPYLKIVIEVLLFRLRMRALRVSGRFLILSYLYFPVLPPRLYDEAIWGFTGRVGALCKDKESLEARIRDLKEQRQEDLQELER